MAFDWLRFLRQYRIEYSTHHVGRGEVTVRCPWCGGADQSQHMAINLEGKGWRCFRQPGIHYGVAPTRLIQALTGVPWTQAQAIAGTPIRVLSDFEKAMQPLGRRSTRELKMPKVFKGFTGLPSSYPFLAYLRRRNFTQEQVQRISADLDYDLRYCTQGAFNGRIIFPIKSRNQLMTWTGRTISSKETLRYKTLSTDPERARAQELPVAVAPITDFLLWQDYLWRWAVDTIYLCEGPFDSLKIDVLGREHGITSTCFFTSGPSEKQIHLLHGILPRFKKRFLLLDQETLSTAGRLQWGALSTLDVQVRRLPGGVKDAGEFSSVDQLLALEAG